jgi:phosphoribosylaminoimidazole carboxylase (NCAIR synthetase)
MIDRMDNVVSEEPAVQSHLYGKPGERENKKLNMFTHTTRNVHGSSFC